ncbi:MAG: RnfABCDGE type electron transport complex subunit G [Chromatiales bacterium]|nr:RnfABCDGE type electron transport complex subunit G [Chromatiales bacterium]
MREQPLNPRVDGWLRPLGGLLLLAVLAGGLVTLTERVTRERISGNQALETLRQLNTVLPPDLYDNDLHRDRVLLTEPRILGSRDPLPAWRARRDGRPVAAVLTVVAPNGYNGPIRMLVALRMDASIIAVRVIEHKETPGIGDVIEADKSDWILGFGSRSLRNPPSARWRLEVDGGDIDHISGASMTGRTIVSALRRSLGWFEENSEALFAWPSDERPAPVSGDP